MQILSTLLIIDLTYKVFIILNIWALNNPDDTQYHMSKPYSIFDFFGDLLLAGIKAPFLLLKGAWSVWQEIGQARWSAQLLVKVPLFLGVVAIIATFFRPELVNSIMLMAGGSFGFSLFLMGITTK